MRLCRRCNGLSKLKNIRLSFKKGITQASCLIGFWRDIKGFKSCGFERIEGYLKFTGRNMEVYLRYQVIY